MQHRNTEYCRLQAIYMNETEESREWNGPEVYKNEWRNTVRHARSETPIEIDRRKSHGDYRVRMFQGRLLLYESGIIVLGHVCSADAVIASLRSLYAWSDRSSVSVTSASKSSWQFKNRKTCWAKVIDRDRRVQAVVSAVDVLYGERRKSMNGIAF